MDKIRRNIRAFFILDLIFGALALFLFWYENIKKGQLSSLQFNDILILTAGIAFLVSGFGLLKRHEWARLIHYPLGFILFFGQNLVGVIYAAVVWIYLSKKEVREYFK